MKRVLMLTQCLDETHWLVGFIPQWVNALAAQVDRLDVITLEWGAYTPPPNVRVYSMGKEQGRGRLGVLAGFYRAALPLIWQVDAVFVHMIPRYGVLAAPLAWLARKPMTLWYTHPSIDLELRMATAFCRRVVTAGPGSFPLATPRLRVLGHGIDTTLFAPGPAEPAEQRFIVHVGRVMPVKNHAAIIRALAAIKDETNAQLVIIGGLPVNADAAYVESLKSLAQELGVGARVRFTGALSAAEVRDWYRRAVVAVNMTSAGSYDKSVLESMAAGTPTVVAHQAFDDLLGEYAPLLRAESPKDVKGLAERLRALLNLPAEERRTIGWHLRERVAAAHSLDSLAKRLANVLLTGEL